MSRDADRVLMYSGMAARRRVALILESSRVDLRGMHDLPGIPLLETNDRRVTDLAVDHLLDRGYDHYAFCGYGPVNFSRRRLGYFVPRIREAGREPHVYEAASGGRDTASAE